MVTEAFVRVVTAFLSWLGGLFPEWTPPDWWTTPPAIFTDLITNIGDIGNILPLPVLITCVALLVSIFWVALGIRLTRVVASYFTGGGGA